MSYWDIERLADEAEREQVPVLRGTYRAPGGSPPITARRRTTVEFTRTTLVIVLLLTFLIGWVIGAMTSPETVARCDQHQEQCTP